MIVLQKMRDMRLLKAQRNVEKINANELFVKNLFVFVMTHARFQRTRRYT